MSKMYQENIGSLNPFVGCLHNCIYCKPSFQRQAKRRKKQCLECYVFKPHFHSNRLCKTPSRTKDGEFVFFPSMGDVAFATREQLENMMTYATKYSKTTFLMQSKDPRTFNRVNWIPANIILGTTLETDVSYFYDNPSKYLSYDSISDAPGPYHRWLDFTRLTHFHKAITIEPILDFRLDDFVQRIESAKPMFVYVGYDSCDCKLPEPPLDKTMTLIERLSKFTEVRKKLLRSAWYEKVSVNCQPSKNQSHGNDRSE